MGRLTSDHELLYNSGPAINPLDSEEFRRQGHMIIDFIADYYKNVDKYPVRSQVEPGYLRKRLPESAPYNPESMETILQDVQEHIVPGITHWQSPNYFAYFPSSGSTAGFLGEMLSSGFNVVGFNWMSSPAATELENIVMDWLGQMLKLPKSFLFSGNGGGVMQGTTCEAILCTLAAARDRVLNKIGRENISKLVGYGSDQTHCALQKAAQIVGIDLKNFRAIKTTKSSSYGLSADSLLPQINLDVEAGLIPLFVCATIDPIKTKYENCNHDTFLELSEEEQTNAFNRALLEMVNASGKVYMTHAFVDGIYAIRFAAGATLTEERHVMVAWTVVQAHVDATLTIPRD